MLNVISPDEAKSIIAGSFACSRTGFELIPQGEALNRTLSRDIASSEDIPGFTRSMVDGYAVRASDTFGCSGVLPAILSAIAPVDMGKAAKGILRKGQCAYVPTGGQLPKGSDSMVMIEHTENFFDGTIGMLKPTAPGMHCIFKGDDIKSGDIVLRAGKKLKPHDIGALAAMGITHVEVCKRPRVGILSTGDEIVGIHENAGDGQVRDVNSHLLGAAVTSSGGKPMQYGICPDDPIELKQSMLEMVSACDVVLVSGGTSVGTKDNAPKTVESIGKILFHGLAMRPGKPALCGEVSKKPVFCLPGHPVAAYFVFLLLVSPLISSMLGERANAPVLKYTARLASRISSNQGREEYIAVNLREKDGEITAVPIMGKSGLISILSGASGYIKIARDQEGIMEGETVEVIPFH